MSHPPLRPDPDLPLYAPTEVRHLTAFGAPVELVLLPDRAARGNRADAARPAFAKDPAPRILATETSWRDDQLALTPNRYPFARQQRILWPLQARREPDAAMWSAACAWSAAANGTAMGNTIGAAATIAWAHVHLTPERLPFLAAIAERNAPDGLFELPPALTLVQKDLPCCILGVRGGDPTARGMALAMLANRRLTPAWNVCVQDDTAWVYPRRLETPAPHFTTALGAAELWGRWCFVDEQPFHNATGADLERALVAAGMPMLST